MKSSDATVLVTGASGGFGSVLVQKLTKEGFRVVGVDRDPSTVSLSNYEHHQLDLSDPETVTKFLQSSHWEFGAVIHCVAEQPLVSVADGSSLDSWRRAFEVNVLSIENIVSVILPQLQKNWPNRIISIGSVHDSLTSAGMAPYSVSKAALAAWVRAAAIDLKGQGVTAISVSVGAMDSAKLQEGLSRFSNPQEKLNSLISRLPAGRLVNPEDLANLCILLFDESMVHLAGSTIKFDGGASTLLGTE